MAIDRKAYKADKKKYKATVKANKKGEKSDSKANNAATKSIAKQKRKDAKLSKKSGTSPKFEYSFTDIQKTRQFPAIKPKRSDYKGDDNENIGRGGKGPKAMSRTGRAKASLMKVKDGLVSRFQGSTPKIGKNELMKPVVESIMPAMVKIAPSPKVKKK